MTIHRTRNASNTILIIALAAVAIAACGNDASRTTVNGMGGNIVLGGGGTVVVGSGGAAPTVTGGAVVGPVGGSASVGCPVNPSACTDGIDNDGDGMIDALDGECSGPCDNDEGTFATGIPGDNKDDLSSCKQDCFFDGNSGSANDGCQFDLRCDPARANATACQYSAQIPASRCGQDSDWDKCRSTCGRIVPNGCDCFGCCDVAGTGTYVRLSSACTAATIADPVACVRCTPVAECDNPCGPCEICIGRPAPSPTCATRPQDGGVASTTDGGTSSLCGNGQTYCGRDPGACPAGYYCLTGCCTVFIP